MCFSNSQVLSCKMALILTRIASEVRVLLVSSHYGIANDEYAGRLNFVTVSVRRRGHVCRVA